MNGLLAACNRFVNTLATTLSGSPQATLRAVPPDTAASIAKRRSTAALMGVDLQRIQL